MNGLLRFIIQDSNEQPTVVISTFAVAQTFVVYVTFFGLFCQFLDHYWALKRIKKCVLAIDLILSVFTFLHLKNWNFKQQDAIDVRIFRPFHVDFHWPNFDIHCDIWHRSNFWNFYPQNKQQPMECDFTEHRFTAIGWTCHKGMSCFFTVMPNI